MAWMNGKRITGMFVHGPENRNSWAHIDGVGWRRLWDAHDAQSEALTIMAAHAREHNRPVNVFEESGKIKIMYVW